MRISTDSVIFDYDLEHEMPPKVLLVLRKYEPFRGMWSLPGGFLNENETLSECAMREVYEETGLDIELDRAFVVDTINRDPRGRVISVVHTALVNRREWDLHPGDDAVDAAWFGLDALPELAADHLEIIRKVLGERYYDTI